MSTGAPAPDLPIDWGRPGSTPWRESGERVALAIEAGASFHEALNEAARGTAAFCAAIRACRPARPTNSSSTTPARCRRATTCTIFSTACAGCVFPLTKARLNQLQAAQIAAAGVAPLRGPVRDALTVFDENAALLQAPEALWDALVARDWRRLFVDLRPLWQQAQLVLFGHALLEKLVYPRKPITAHVYRAPAAINSIADFDAWVARDLDAERLARKPFAPLPVLGVPGWWPDNQNFSFYDDSLYSGRCNNPEQQKSAARLPAQLDMGGRDLISCARRTFFTDPTENP